MPLQPQWRATLLTQYDKAAGAAIGAALGTLIAWQFPMPVETQGALTLVLTAGLTWLVPNKGA